MTDEKNTSQEEISNDELENISGGMINPFVDGKLVDITPKKPIDNEKMILGVVKPRNN